MVGIVDMILNPSITLEDAMKMVIDKVAHTENHEGALAALDATQKVLVRMIAQDPSLKPFSKAVVLNLRVIIGKEKYV